MALKEVSKECLEKVFRFEKIFCVVVFFLSGSDDTSQ